MTVFDVRNIRDGVAVFDVRNVSNGVAAWLQTNRLFRRQKGQRWGGLQTNCDCLDVRKVRDGMSCKQTVTVFDVRKVRDRVAANKL